MAEKVIICVDDEKIVLNSLKRELKELFGNDYLYEVAETADDALELIYSKKPRGSAYIL